MWLGCGYGGSGYKSYSRDGSTLVRREYFDRSMETGAGGIYTTADDLLRWNKALDAPGFLSAQGLDFMFTPHPPGNFGGTSLIRVSGCVWVGLTLILMFAALAVVLWLLKGPKGPNAAN